jgi:hypothetical protein
VDVPFQHSEDERMLYEVDCLAALLGFVIYYPLPDGTWTHHVSKWMDVNLENVRGPFSTFHLFRYGDLDNPPETYMEQKEFEDMVNEKRLSLNKEYTIRIYQQPTNPTNTTKTEENKTEDKDVDTDVVETDIVRAASDQCSIS